MTHSENPMEREPSALSDSGSDASETFLRRWQRGVLLAYVVGMGSIAIVIACESWLTGR